MTLSKFEFCPRAILRGAVAAVRPRRDRRKAAARAEHHYTRTPTVVCSRRRREVELFRRRLWASGLGKFWAAALLFLLFKPLTGLRPLFACSPSSEPQQSSAAPPEKASEFISRGFELLSQNDAGAAELAFRKAVDARPELAVAHRGLGLALWAERQGSAALRELTLATRLAPEDAEAHYALAKLAWTLSTQPELAQGGASPLSFSDYQNLAIAELGKARSLHAQDYDLSLNLAELYLDAGRAKEALAQAEDAVRLATTAEQRAMAHVVSGRAHFAVGEEDKAEVEFMAALALDSNQGEAHLGLGQLRLFQRKIPQAEEEFRRAIRASPNLAPAYPALAEVLASRGQPGESRELLEKAVNLDHRDWHSRYQLAQLLIETGQAARAADLLAQVARERPDFLPAREQLGLSFLRRGDLERAAAQAEALVAQAPRAAEGHRLNALVLWKRRDFEGSLAECALALASEPESAQMLALQALELWQLNRKKEAQTALVQAAKVQPKVTTAEVFCRLLFCDARDIGPVQDFVRKNRWVVVPPSEP